MQYQSRDDRAGPHYLYSVIERKIKDAQRKAGLARIMSVYQNVIPVGSLRINLRWEGHHEITDLELEHVGDFVSCETETAHTGWVIVKARGVMYFGDINPLLNKTAL